MSEEKNVPPKPLTVEKLIAALSKCKHKDTALVTFFVDGIEEEYGLRRIGQFGVVPDVNFYLASFNSSPEDAKESK